jgi:crotonobetainyl-CoA:carnitine CoA-transferase CaiB-like acyl-CoA transferase
MTDAIAWLTQTAWPDGHDAIGPATRLGARDGFVAAAAEAVRLAALPEARAAQAGKVPSRADWVAACARHGIAAVPVLEPAEVFAQPARRARGSVFQLRSGKALAPALVLPFGLRVTPALRPARFAPLGEDNAMLAAMPATTPKAVS